MGGVYILHHLGFRIDRIDLDRGAVEPLPMLNIPGVEGLKVGMFGVVPKLRAGLADNEVVKLNPVDAESKK